MFPFDLGDRLASRWLAEGLIESSGLGWERGLRLGASAQRLVIECLAAQEGPGDPLDLVPIPGQQALPL